MSTRRSSSPGSSIRVFHVLALGDGRVVSDSDDRTVRVWSPGSADALVLRGHTDRPYGLDATPGGDLVVSAGVDGQAIVWSTEHGSATPLRGHNGRVHRAMFLPDGASVLTAGSDGALRTWGLDGQPLAEVQAHDGTAVWAVASGETVWSAGSDRALRRWRLDVPGGAPEAVAEGLGERGGVTLRPHLLDGDEVLVCSGAPRELVVVGAQTRRIVLPVEPECASMGVSPDGRTVAVPSGPTIGLVDAVDGSYRALTSLNADVHAIAWSPDGAYVAAAVLDGTVRLVRVADGASAIVARGRGPMLGVAFGPDSATLAAAGVDAVVRVVPVDPSALVPPDPALLHARIAGLTGMIAPE
jgi:WD40 repeat protein